MRSVTIGNEGSARTAVRRIRRFNLQRELVLVLACGLFAVSCNGDPRAEGSEREAAASVSLLEGSASDPSLAQLTTQATCDPPTAAQYPIIVGQNVTAGYVTVASSCTGLTFTAHLYEPSATVPSGHDYVFDEVAIDVQTAVPPVRLPPGQFAYSYAYATPSRADFSQTIPYSAFKLPADACAAGSAVCGSPLAILFHLKITETRGDGTQVAQTGWSGDNRFTGRTWGYYIGFTPCCTCPISPEPALASNCDGSLHYSVQGATCHWTFASGGATVATSDECTGDLALSVPSGTTLDATVHVVGTDGCTGDASTSTTVVEPLAATISSGNLACEGSSTGTATASATGGTGPYTFLWSNGDTDAIISAVPAGSYSVTITDANACTASASVTMTVPTPLSVEIRSDSVACNGGATGNAVAIPSGGTEPYLFLWSNGEVTPTLRNAGAGTYAVTVSDANGCSASASVTIAQPPPLAVAITAGNVSCHGGTSGSASAQASGGVGPYAYLWSSGQTGPTLGGAAAGTYTVTVTDANGCPASASVTIVEPPPLAIGINSDNVKCNGGLSGSATAQASGGTGSYSYLWSNGHAGPTLGNVGAGSYSVTVSDANACVASASVTITQPSPLAVGISSENVKCNGGLSGSATAQASGGTGSYSYLWSNGHAGATLVNIGAGTYSVTVTDVNACPAGASVTIAEPPPLTVGITSENAKCHGGTSGSATAQASGGAGPYSFLWSNGHAGATLSNLGAGTYSVTVSDANACPAGASVTIADPPAISVMIDAIATCNGLHYAAAASGGTPPLAPSVLVIGTDGFSERFTELTRDIVAQQGTYTTTLDVSDANGCRASAMDVVDVYAILMNEVFAQGSCPTVGALTFDFGSFVVGGSAHVVYRWVLFGDGIIVSTQPELGDETTGGTATVSGAGEYYAELTVTDLVTGCSAAHTARAQVYEPLHVTLSASSDALVCPMVSDAVTYTAAVSGGSGAYAITWSGDQPGDTCADGTPTCVVTPNGFCDTRTITAAVTDSEATSCAQAVSLPAVYEKKTTVTAGVN